jgi:flagellar biosynthesis anti-sigma factor FlgM
MRISAVTQPLSAELRKVESAKKDKEKSGKTGSADRSDFSQNAQRLSETKAQFQTIATSISAQPDVRTEKIAEVRQKIENGYYNSDAFIDQLAEKLMKEFGLNTPTA